MKVPESIRTFFDENVGDYEAKHYGAQVRSFMMVRQTRILEVVDSLGLPRGAKALDAGCGPGYLLEALARRGFQVYGLDAAEGMVRSTRARLTAANPEYSCTLEVGNIEKLPFGNKTFDLVCSAGVIEYLREDRTVLGELFRVLRPSGALILPVTNFWSPVNYLDFFVEFLKRQRWFLRPFNAVWRRLGHRPVLSRHFRVRRHRPANLMRSLAEAGFVLRDQVYFYFLPWPRPLDRLFPKATAAVERSLEPYGRSWIGTFAEGYLTLSIKPANGP
ncbi:MAG: methyltransferase domain-containing protein [Gammaproteobacteria bacterium]